MNPAYRGEPGQFNRFLSSLFLSHDTNLPSFENEHPFPRRGAFYYQISRRDIRYGGKRDLRQRWLRTLIYCFAGEMKKSMEKGQEEMKNGERRRRNEKRTRRNEESDPSHVESKVGEIKDLPIVA
ncbi:hypothetical protein AVEN_45936-1 [Araneus ventricosus]|uniref:Uncharacterized protein n=1 Tax=Araneus ventricosus TaxID=182803 RepID=A0A4Y2E815_ARAVE|nr:hypothetical protein AVEN_45936-1 [Araneus ventricosus]